MSFASVPLADIAGDDRVWHWMSDAFPKPYTLEVTQHWVERDHLEFGGENCACRPSRPARSSTQ